MARSRYLALILALAFAAGVSLAACGDDDGDTAADTTETSDTTEATTPESEASVRFVEPADGATVTSPVKVVMEATNFTVEPAGEVHEGVGHFHIVIDGDCVTPGEVIPSDDSHKHFGKAQTETELELSPGSHSLCLQAGDGAHSALDLTDTITISVTG